MFLVAGLGNPDKGYARNRHNVGFMAADTIVCRHNFLEYKNKFEAKITQGKISDSDVLIIKPLTFMNLSGKAVSKTSNFYKIALNNIIIIHDDLDLELGKVKVKTGGGNGGHNGLKSIDACLGNNNYIRIRIGIGRPAYSNMVTSYVLGDFEPNELEIINQKLELIAEHFALLLNNDAAGFMNKIAAAKDKSSKPKENKKKEDNKKIEKTTKEPEPSLMAQALAKALDLINKNIKTD